MTDVNVKWNGASGDFSVTDSYGGYDIGEHDWASAPISETVQFQQLLSQAVGEPIDDELNEIAIRHREGNFDDADHDDIEYLIHESGIFQAEEGHFYGKYIEAELAASYVVSNELWEAVLKLEPQIKNTLKKAGFQLFRKVIEEI